MHTLAAALCRQITIRIVTARPTEFIDITDRIASLVDAAGLYTGMVNVQTLHTTTAVVVNEHEPLLLDDFGTLLDRLAPAKGRYRHDDPAVRTVNLVPGERPNGHSHCRALFLNPSACLNIVNGTLRLGEWQRLFFVELDGPRSRDLSVVLVGEQAR
jgi:secondary thiamine-phosphate synthase enzyme